MTLRLQQSLPRQEHSHSFFCKHVVDTCVQRPPILQTVEMRLLVARDKHKVIFACTQCVRSYLKHVAVDISDCILCRIKLRQGLCLQEASYRVGHDSIFSLVTLHYVSRN